MTMLTTFVLGLLMQQPSPDSLYLNYCYSKARANYPFAEVIELQHQITELSTRIAHTAYYPRVEVNGRASYQSEVTEFGIPGAGSPPAVSKDQYEASLNIRQNIYSGGTVGIRKKLEQMKGRQAVQSAQVELHKIRSQIDQLYFGILLSKRQAENVQLVGESVRERLGNVRVKVENGVLLPSQQRILEAELIKVSQDSADIQSNIRAGYSMLSQIIGETIETGTPLILPQIPQKLERFNARRPEMEVFDTQRNVLGHQKELAATKKRPNISAFAKASYGRPGLNFLNDDFHDYYMIGLNVKWDFLNFLNADDEQQRIRIQQQQVDEHKRAFSVQLDVALNNIQERIYAIKENIKRDKEIIALRDKIVKESASQLENGAITATEYLTELNRFNQARLSLSTNKLKLVQTQIEYLTTLGADTDEASFSYK
ncbi:MAG: TolC family protein [Balneolaceae bacterium]|nr:TolC family protein [Balneolaceae bacterium]